MECRAPPARLQDRRTRLQCVRRSHARARLPHRRAGDPPNPRPSFALEQPLLASIPRPPTELLPHSNGLRTEAARSPCARPSPLREPPHRLRTAADRGHSRIHRRDTALHGWSDVRRFFCADSKTIEAVDCNFMIIGEAARHVPADVEAAHPGIPWAQLRGMRNIVAHEYFGVNSWILWQTVPSELCGERIDLVVFEQARWPAPPHRAEHGARDLLGGRHVLRRDGLP